MGIHILLCIYFVHCWPRVFYILFTRICILWQSFKTLEIKLQLQWVRFPQYQGSAWLGQKTKQEQCCSTAKEEGKQVFKRFDWEPAVAWGWATTTKVADFVYCLTLSTCTNTYMLDTAGVYICRDLLTSARCWHYDKQMSSWMMHNTPTATAMCWAVCTHGREMPGQWPSKNCC